MTPRRAIVLEAIGTIIRRMKKRREIMTAPTQKHYSSPKDRIVQPDPTADAAPKASSSSSAPTFAQVQAEERKRAYADRVAATVGTPPDVPE